MAALANSSVIKAVGPPAGFGELEQPREVVADLYFGNRKVGEAWLIAQPGSVTFKDPAQLFKVLPELRASPEVMARLSGKLPDHVAQVCPVPGSTSCKPLETQDIDVIYDADRFRLDLFVNPRFLNVVGSSDAYLQPPTTPLSLTSSIGGAIAGSTQGETVYNFQNRTILGFRNGRIRSDSAYASDLGFIVDDLVAEVDTRQHRYAAGLFWAPGIDFTGRRRIAGVGFTTQFDTRVDHEALQATPLILFLSQPSRVEILIDGRLVTSGSYPAGNQAIDSSALPDGSYTLLLRIRAPDGSVREERRFFVKSSAIAPLGKPVYFAFAGLLANTRADRAISVSNTVYYQVGAAYRLNEKVAVDAAILGTEDKPIAQLGGWLITDVARVRAAALISGKGDKGVLLQLGSSGMSKLNFSLDVRRVWSKTGEPLIPLPTYVDNFGSVPPLGAQSLSGSYAQATGSVTYSIGSAFLSLSGSYRHDEGYRSDYSIGPAISWPVLNRGGFQLILNADAQRSRSTAAAFAGVRLLYTDGGKSAVATAGYASLKDRDDGRRSARAVGSLSAQWFNETEDHTQVALEAAIQRDVETTTARANAEIGSQLGSARVEVLQGIEGGSATQYGFNFQTGVAFGSSALKVGGRDLNQSAVIATLAGSSSNTAFDVLIDDVPRARLTAGSSVPIFLEAYHAYQLRLQPVEAVPVAYDSQSRTITLYPGTVQHLRWSADRLVTVFGKAVAANGSPLVNAAIKSSTETGQTDENGYFQVDAAPGETLEFQAGGSPPCTVSLAGVHLEGDYARLGEVICK
ncbi:TcfC E-set like domain-containing protein [Sphingomonas daechungensis]